MGFQMRHRRAPERRQVHDLQRDHRDAERAGGELPVLHDRARTWASWRCRIPASRGSRRSRIPKSIVRRRSSSSTSPGSSAGASKGEGLGNQFLSHIREVDAIAHVVRCFEDDDVVHVDGQAGPASRDVAVDRPRARLQGPRDRAQTGASASAGRRSSGDRAAQAEVELLERLAAVLDAGKPLRTESFWREDEAGSRLVLSRAVAAHGEAGALRRERGGEGPARRRGPPRRAAARASPRARGRRSS